jgi:hypothetical protein
MRRFPRPLSPLLAAACRRPPPSTPHRSRSARPLPTSRCPAIDGKTYTLAIFKDAKALVGRLHRRALPDRGGVRGRLKRLVADYEKKGVAFAVIQPNNARALRLDEMGYTTSATRSRT